MTPRRMRYGSGLLAALALLIIPLVGCGASTGKGVDLKPAVAEAREADSATATSGQSDAESLSPRLGYVRDGEAIALENGGRISISGDKIAEVFIAPYPPDWNTDLNLFLLDKETFQPVTDVVVDLEYDMVYMDHGIDSLKGTKIADGHYVMPLSFLMYGDWSVDVTMQLPEGKEHLQFIVKFLPE